MRLPGISPSGGVAPNCHAHLPPSCRLDKLKVFPEAEHPYTGFPLVSPTVHDMGAGALSSNVLSSWLRRTCSGGAQFQPQYWPHHPCASLHHSTNTWSTHKKTRLA